MVEEINKGAMATVETTMRTKREDPTRMTINRKTIVTKGLVD